MRAGTIFEPLGLQTNPVGRAQRVHMYSDGVWSGLELVMPFESNNSRTRKLSIHIDQTSVNTLS